MWKLVLGLGISRHARIDRADHRAGVAGNDIDAHRQADTRGLAERDGTRNGDAVHVVVGLHAQRGGIDDCIGTHVSDGRGGKDSDQRRSVHPERAASPTRLAERKIENVLAGLDRQAALFLVQVQPRAGVDPGAVLDRGQSRVVCDVEQERRADAALFAFGPKGIGEFFQTVDKRRARELRE